MTDPNTAKLVTMATEAYKNSDGNLKVATELMVKRLRQDAEFYTATVNQLVWDACEGHVRAVHHRTRADIIRNARRNPTKESAAADNRKRVEAQARVNLGILLRQIKDDKRSKKPVRFIYPEDTVTKARQKLAEANGDIDRAVELMLSH